MKKNSIHSVHVLVYGALLVALSFAISFIEIPIIPGFSWLKLDFSMVPILLGALVMGPLVGIYMTGIMQFIIFISKSDTGGVGQLANFIIIAVMILAVSLIYRHRSDLKGFIIGLLVGTIGFTIAAVLANKFLLVPLFFPDGFPGGEANLNVYLWKILPIFNGIKGFTNALLALALYARLHGFIKDPAFMAPSKRKNMTQNNSEQSFQS